MSDEVRRRFFADNIPNPTLRDLLHDDEEPFKARTNPEDAVWAALPGDDLSGHVLGPHTDNPFLGKPYEELKALMESGTLGRADQIEVSRALHQHELHHFHPHTGQIVPSGEYEGYSSPGVRQLGHKTIIESHGIKPAG